MLEKHDNALLVLPEISGDNLVIGIVIDFENRDLKFKLHDWGVDDNKENKYLEVKKLFERGSIEIRQIEIDDNLNSLVKHLLYDYIKEFQASNQLEIFIDNTFAILNDYLKRTSATEKPATYLLDFDMYLNLFQFYNRFDLVRRLLYYKQIKISFSLIHNLEYHLREKILNANLLFSRLSINSVLNNIVKEKLDDFKIFIDAKLNDLYSDDYSFYKSLFGINLSIQEINNQFPDNFILKSNTDFETKREDALRFIEENSLRNPIYSYNIIFEQYSNLETELVINRLWNNGDLWLSYNESPLSYFNGYISFLYFIENFFYKMFISFIIGLQNDFRVSIGLPKIGEGWVSETNLFNTLNNFFDTKVVQHASPNWLGRQHLDVFFPRYNIAIEYQGKQHTEPVEFFGGQEGFEKTVERDNRKKQLCKLNKCTLLYVYPETNIDEFIEKLEKIIIKLEVKITI